MSAATVSALFPDRPIRPLPKRRLRERLSPDVADSIEYPPAPETSTSLFYYPYSPRDEDSEPAPYGRRETRPGLQGPASRDGPGQESDDDAARMSRIASLAIDMSDSMSRPSRTSVKQGQGKKTNPHPPASAASSSTSLADGYYDPFEITNNKKKRKIPTAGDSVLNGNHGVHDGANGAESPGTPIPSIEGHGELSSPVGPSSYVGTNSHYSGIHNNLSGPGRGRYGRVRKGRSPLRALTEGSYNLNWANRNGNGKLRPSQWVSPSNENRGIISAAIANAEKLPTSAGQENLSLLQQQSQQSGKTQPVTTQFTFTCESQVPGSIAWPQVDRRHTVAGLHAPAATREDGGRLSAPASYPTTALPVRNMADQPDQAPAAQPSAIAQPAPAPAPPAPPKKPTRRQVNQELRQAAADRRHQQQRENARTKSKAKEDFWLCEYCEYEAIFGEPPRALIRQYEIKDRRARREEAERKRLLEKAKAKSRKTRKNANKSAAAAKDTAAASASQDKNVPHSVVGPPPAPPTDGPGPEDEGYEDPEGYDGYGGHDAEEEHDGGDGWGENPDAVGWEEGDPKEEHDSDGEPKGDRDKGKRTDTEPGGPAVGEEGTGKGVVTEEAQAVHSPTVVRQENQNDKGPATTS